MATTGDERGGGMISDVLVFTGLDAKAAALLFKACLEEGRQSSGTDLSVTNTSKPAH